MSRVLITGEGADEVFGGYSKVYQPTYFLTALRKFDSIDPVKYDFALFGLGVENDFQPPPPSPPPPIQAPPGWLAANGQAVGTIPWRHRKI